MSTQNSFAVHNAAGISPSTRRVTVLRELSTVRVLKHGFGSIAWSTVSAPEQEMPVTELLRRAYYFWKAAVTADEASASEAVWSEALDALLDRLLCERPELRWRFPLSNVEKARLVAKRATEASFKLERG